MPFQCLEGGRRKSGCLLKGRKERKKEYGMTVVRLGVWVGFREGAFGCWCLIPDLDFPSPFTEM